MIKNAQLLQLLAEDKLINLLTNKNIPKRLEASGVLFLNDLFYIIFDNSREVAKVKKDLNEIEENSLITLGGENNEVGFEDIAYNHKTSKFYLIIEALKSKKEVYKAQIEEYDLNFNFLEKNWVDFSFESKNKGFEGLEWVEKKGQEYLLAMCEGNKCQGGRKGRKVGNGRIQVLQKSEKIWKKIQTVKLPKSVKFEDYSAISLENNRLAVISQASAKLWIGRFQDESWDFIDEGIVYAFPRNKKGKIIYGNVEGICWLNPNQIVVVSDKYKPSEQPKRYKKKEQSIHIFQIPHNK